MDPAHIPHDSPLLLRWQIIPSLGDWQNIRARKWRDWRTDMDRWLWSPILGWLGSKWDWQVEGYAGQRTEEKVWRTGVDGQGLPYGTQDRGKHSRLLQQQKGVGLLSAPVERKQMHSLPRWRKRWCHWEDKAAKAIKKCRIERKGNSGQVYWESFKFHNFHTDQGLWLSRIWLVFVVRENQVSPVV